MAKQIGQFPSTLTTGHTETDKAIYDLLDKINSVAQNSGIPTWDNKTTYQVNTVVHYQAALYVCIKTAESIVPTNTVYWTQL
jgi:hypothetical protein